MLVGLTGSMGSGKTLTSSLFRKLGAHIIDADVICRELVEPGKSALDEITQYFGKDILLADGTLNRPQMARIVFNDADKKMVLESILHPKVFEEEQRVYKDIRAREPNALVIVDAALLIESGNHNKMDKVLVVTCEREKQIQRLSKQGKWNFEEIRRRMTNQMKSEDKIKCADYVIHNDGSIEDLGLQVQSVFQELSNHR